MLFRWAVNRNALEQEEQLTEVEYIHCSNLFNPFYTDRVYSNMSRKAGSLGFFLTIIFLLRRNIPSMKIFYVEMPIN